MEKGMIRILRSSYSYVFFRSSIFGKLVLAFLANAGRFGIYFKQSSLSKLSYLDIGWIKRTLKTSSTFRSIFNNKSSRLAFKIRNRLSLACLVFNKTFSGFSFSKSGIVVVSAVTTNIILMFIFKRKADIPAGLFMSVLFLAGFFLIFSETNLKRALESSFLVRWIRK